RFINVVCFGLLRLGFLQSSLMASRFHNWELSNLHDSTSRLSYPIIKKLFFFTS
ncbi:hypothetical protein ACJX0J_017663, partial [Zea mays]